MELTTQTMCTIILTEGVSKKNGKPYAIVEVELDGVTLCSQWISPKEVPYYKELINNN